METSGTSSNWNCFLLYLLNLHAKIYNDLVKFFLWFLADVSNCEINSAYILSVVQHLKICKVLFLFFIQLVENIE